MTVVLLGIAATDEGVTLKGTVDRFGDEATHESRSREPTTEGEGVQVGVLLPGKSSLHPMGPSHCSDA